MADFEKGWEVHDEETKKAFFNRKRSQPGPHFGMDGGYLYEKNKKAYEEVFADPLGATLQPDRGEFNWFTKNQAMITQVPPQEIKFHKIPMPAEVRAALIFGLAVVFCITGLIAYLIYAITT